MSPFKPIKPYRVSGGVAEQLKEAIILGQYKPGDKLPGERDLAAQFSVSRLSIREACRKLENSGFVRIRQGIGGGTFVTELDFDHLLGTFLDLFMSDKISIPALHQVRVLVETEVARLAALHITPTYAKRLQEALDAEELPMRSHADHINRKSTMHYILAEMCGNPLLEVLVKFIMTSTARVLEALQPDAELMHPVGTHQPIVEAVLSGNPRAAAAAMKTHGLTFGKKLVEMERGFRVTQVARAE
ncbi:MAG TPA: FadR/GntR family transcriptional regulator [Syntrophorhabdales bacterium]|nr:FadR/GntR family transcriptional regulator [Syntrophorhabdales bacterium]